MSKFAPMLAVNADLKQIKYPVVVSPKYDGVRAVVVKGKLLSRKLLPIPNGYIQSFSWSRFEGCDGELIVGSPVGSDCFRRTTSGVMSQSGEPDFYFYVFDRMGEGDYSRRFLFRGMPEHPRVLLVKQQLVSTPMQLTLALDRNTYDGYEGSIIRDPYAPYKHGRSTVKEGYLLKVKPFADSEGIVVGFEEKEHNDNVLKKDNLGHAKRSSAKAGKRGADTLGAILLRSTKWPDVIRVGTGFDDSLRQDIWNDKGHYLNRIAKFRYQDYGGKDKPRHASFLGFRNANDL